LRLLCVGLADGFVRASGRLIDVARLPYKPRADHSLRLGLVAELEHQRRRLRSMTLEPEPECLA
jgi:hypothetical protein